MAWTPPGQGGGGAWADESMAVCVPRSSECGTQGLSPGGVWLVADFRACPGPRTAGSPWVGHKSAPQPEGRCPQCGGLWCWAPTRVPPGLGATITCMLGEAVTGFGESRAKGRTPGTVWRGLLHFLCERKFWVTCPLWTRSWAGVGLVSGGELRESGRFWFTHLVILSPPPPGPRLRLSGAGGAPLQDSLLTEPAGV